MVELIARHGADEATDLPANYLPATLSRFRARLTGSRDVPITSRSERSSRFQSLRNREINYHSAVQQILCSAAYVHSVYVCLRGVAIVWRSECRKALQMRFIFHLEVIFFHMKQIFRIEKRKIELEVGFSNYNNKLPAWSW